MSDPPLLHVASALVVGIDDPLSRWHPHSHGLGSLVIDASSWLGAQLGYVDSPCGFSSMDSPCGLGFSQHYGSRRTRQTLQDEVQECCSNYIPLIRQVPKTSVDSRGGEIKLYFSVESITRRPQATGGEEGQQI